jgi:hypothetical protein
MNLISLRSPGIFRSILNLRKRSRNAVTVAERTSFAGWLTMCIWKCPYRLIIVGRVENSGLLGRESIV